MTPTPRVAILVSGSGSNLQALLEQCADGSVPAQIATVISNRPDAYALERARAAGVATVTLDHRDYPDRPTFEAALAARIDESAADWVLLAGFMRILTPTFVDHFAGRLLNIHPSLLPAFRGLHTHERALQARVEEHGCTVHFVTSELDAGPPIAQGVVPVHPDDTACGLQQRVLEQEHRIYPLVLRWLANGRLRLTADGPELDGRPLDSAVRIGPEDDTKAL